jgi:Phage integrase family
VLVIDRSYSDDELKLTKTNRRRTVEVISPPADDPALHCPVGAGPDDLVCPSEIGGPLDLSNWRTRVWDPARVRAGVRAVPYDGRHTFASLLIHEGRPVPYVTAALGHASAVTTLNHYAHVFDEARLAPARVDGRRHPGRAGADRGRAVARNLRDGPPTGGSSTPVPIGQISLFSSDFLESGRRDSNPRPSARKATPGPVLVRVGRP